MTNATMPSLQLTNLAPLIAASEIWAEDPTRPLWLAHAPETGRITLADVEPDPETHFADILLLEALDMAPKEVTRPTVHVAWPSGHHQLQLPAFWAEGGAPYIGRPYALGQYDCYTILRDWMARERGHEMAMLTDTPERLVNQWLTDGVFVTNPELHRWDRVIVPQAGDGILFSLSRRDEDSPNRANHCGVYLGDGRFLHHFPNRASCIQDFDARWRAWVVSFMRIKT